MLAAQTLLVLCLSCFSALPMCPGRVVTCLTIDLLLEPGDEATMLSCGDQLHGGSGQLNAGDCSVPQTFVSPEMLHSICMHLGQACLQRLIIGGPCGPQHNGVEGGKHGLYSCDHDCFGVLQHVTQIAPFHHIGEPDQYLG